LQIAANSRRQNNANDGTDICSLRHLPKVLMMSSIQATCHCLMKKSRCLLNSKSLGVKSSSHQVVKQTTQTPEGMAIVCEHSQAKNAQSVWAKLQDRHAHSQAATLARDILEQEIADFRLEATWKMCSIPHSFDKQGHGLGDFARCWRPSD
jgi:hypothetical protein